MNSNLILSTLFCLLIGLAGCDATEPEPIYGPESGTKVERSYTKSIVREADNNTEASLIAAAEAAYPPRDSVLAVVPEQQHQYIPDTGYWFCSSFDGILIPYAITGDAIRYYSDKIDALKTSPEASFLITADLQYRATVSFEERYTVHGTNPANDRPLIPETFDRVWVVNMSLKWDQYCGALCAMYIDHQRIVVFDEGGTLLRIFLDGSYPVIVS